MIRNMTAEQRRDFDYNLMPLEAVLLDDPDIPEELRSIRPPAWYRKEGMSAPR